MTGKKSTKSSAHNGNYHEYLQSDEHLLLKYPNADRILSRLADINADIKTYELLGDLFFKFIQLQAKDEYVKKEQLIFISLLRDDILDLYQLARAAKMLKFQLPSILNSHPQLIKSSKQSNRESQIKNL